MNEATLFFFISQLHDMLLSLHNRSSREVLLETDETDETFKVIENKMNFITNIFCLKYYLDLGLLRLSSWENNFSKHSCSKPFLF